MASATATEQAEIFVLTPDGLLWYEPVQQLSCLGALLDRRGSTTTSVQARLKKAETYFWTHAFPK